MKRATLVFTLVVAALSHAEGATTPTKGGKQKAPKMDLGLPTFGAIPKGGEIEKAKDTTKPEMEPHVNSNDAVYTVTKIMHAKNFMRGPQGSTPINELASIPLTGNPPTTDKFTTMVRVKCPQKVNANIEIAVLDPRSNTMMSGDGTLLFHGNEETEWPIDWDPTPLRSGGTYQVLVKINGQVMGTWPLKVDEPKK